MAHDDCLKQGEIATMQRDIEELKKQQSKNTEDVQYLKEHRASSDEKFDRIFSLLGDLKSSIDEIQKAIKEKNERLPTLVYSVAGVVIGGTLSGMFVWLLTK